MKTIAHFSYTENIVPPRCRKPRPVEFQDGYLEFEVPEVSAAEAPVAIRSRLILDFSEPDKLFEVEYRWHGGKLWTALRIDNCAPRGHTSREQDWEYLPLPSHVDTGSSIAYYYGLHTGSHYRRHEVEAKLQQSLSDNLIVDGVRYRPAGEPRYLVMTFGLGHNHGSTAVFADDSYNPNISRERYFNLFERDKALELATEIATRRGDTKSLPMRINRGNEFDILIPEAIKVNPAAQHGTGDPSINMLEGITEVAGDAGTAGMMVMAAALSQH